VLAAKEEGPALRKAEATRVFQAALDECLVYVRGILDQQDAFAKQNEPVQAKGKRGRDGNAPVHPVVTEAAPWVSQFREEFGASVWDKAVKSEKLDLSVFSK
jgi:hypothetical protein